MLTSHLLEFWISLTETFLMKYFTSVPVDLESHQWNPHYKLIPASAFYYYSVSGCFGFPNFCITSFLDFWFSIILFSKCSRRYFERITEFQVICASGTGRGERNSAQGSRQASQRDQAIHAGRYLGGNQIGRAAGQKETPADPRPHQRQFSGQFHTVLFIFTRGQFLVDFFRRFLKTVA
jgi:hypothetical protein